MDESRDKKPEIRVPVPSAHVSFGHGWRRSLSIGQLAVLLWHLYRCAKDESLGYLDAEASLHKLLTNQLTGNVFIHKLDLERLLFAANISEQVGAFTSPDGKTFEQFVRAILPSDEVFDREWNLLLPQEEAKRIRNRSRYIKKLVKRSNERK